MLCQICGKHEATTHVTQIINGKKSELYLCPYCAGQTANPFFSMFSDMFFSGMPYDFETKEITCPTCGMTLSQLRETGRVGCSKCYSVFSDLLLPYIRQVQGTDHQRRAESVLQNKMAEPSQDSKKPKTKIEKLQEELKKAIAEENYEQAAVLRDQIKACREERQK